MASEFWGSGMFIDSARLVMEFAFGVLRVHRLEARAALRNERGNAALQEAWRGARRRAAQVVSPARRAARSGDVDDPRRRVARRPAAARIPGHPLASRRSLSAVPTPSRFRLQTSDFRLTSPSSRVDMSGLTATMDVRDFDFDLPADLIAQEPAADRGGSRLLVVDRASGAMTHSRVAALPDLLRAGDLLVVNNTRVFPARLLGRRVPSGGAVECLLVRRVMGSDGCQTGVGHPSDPTEGADGGQTGVRRVSDTPPTPPGAQVWEALMHPGQKLKPGARVVFEGVHTAARRGPRAAFLRTPARPPLDRGRRRVDAAVDAIGHVPLPPYIKRDDRPDDRDRYQTVFARTRGSVAAPTAGLHFTPSLLAALAARGVDDRGDHAARRLRHVSAGSRRARRGSPRRGGALRDQRRQRPRPSTGALDERPPRHRRRHDDDADARGGGRAHDGAHRRRARARPISSSIRASSSASSAAC